MKTFEELIGAAEEGYIEAQYEIGKRYQNGYGVEKDPGKALYYCLRAKDQGKMIGKSELKELFEVPGLMDMLIKEAEMGDAEAQYEVGVYYDEIDIQEGGGSEWFYKAMAQGHVYAQYRYGKVLEFWPESLDRERTDEILKLYKEAADKGHAGAQYMMGLVAIEGYEAIVFNNIIHFDQKFTDMDRSESIRWIKKASERGHAGAWYKLGMLYEEGEAVKKDILMAVKCYKKAAELLISGGEPIY